MGLNILIVDDEPPARARMRQLLDDCGQSIPIKAVAEAENGPQALEAVDEFGPDVVLLDIHMPGMDGLEVARHIAQREGAPALIFVTAFEEHALQAFEVQALDYLMKPVRAERLMQALERLQQRLSRVDTLERVDEVARSLGKARTHITVPQRGRMILVPVEDIVFLRAEMKYVTIRTAEREYLTEESLTTLEVEFGDRFVRVHRNALVARKSIVGFERCLTGNKPSGRPADGHWEVLLKELPDRLPVSRRQWTIVRGVVRGMQKSQVGATAQ